MDWMARTDDGVAQQEREPLLAEGTTAGDWMVRGFLARGGSSEVYCASHRVTGAPVVLKVLWNDNPRLRERFQREREFLAGNPSPAFPALYGTGTTDGHPWIALERLDAYDPLPESEADVARYLLEVAEGVAALHTKGWIHRDIKPANAMRRPSDGRAVLIDFSLIKAFGEDGRTPDADELSVVDGQVMALGTPGYAAPEQWNGSTVSPAADVFSLGMLAVRCGAGRLSRPWRRIVLKAIAGRPEFRYGSANELALAIRRRHWMARAMVALAVGAALLSACGVWVAVGG